MEASTELDNLMNSIEAMDVDQNIMDGWSFVWGTDSYRPKDFYKHFFRNIDPPAYLTAIWKNMVTMKHCVFAWPLLVDRINTRDMLKRRNFNIGDDHSCVLCKEPVKLFVQF